MEVSIEQIKSSPGVVVRLGMIHSFSVRSRPSVAATALIEEVGAGGRPNSAMRSNWLRFAKTIEDQLFSRCSTSCPDRRPTFGGPAYQARAASRLKARSRNGRLAVGCVSPGSARLGCGLALC